MTTLIQAAGTVDCVYPSPIEPSKLSELIKFESTNTDKQVHIQLSCKFEDGEQLPAQIGKHKQDEYSVDFKAWLDYEIECNYKRRYMHDEYPVARADTVSELVAKLQESGYLKGTLSVKFQSYPNGANTYPVVSGRFNFVL